MRNVSLFLAVAAPVALIAVLASSAIGQADTLGDGTATVAQIQARLDNAQRESAAAAARGQQLEQEARTVTQAAEKTAREAAALAARIQQAEAGIDAAEARIALVGQARAALDRRLGERREPLVRLAGALQKLARRPLALAALRPGSLRETVYLRAMLESTIPEVRLRTAALRGEIARGEALEREAQQALAALQVREEELADRRRRLAALESQQRLASRRTGGDADRENERALALAEEARDLDTLIARLDETGTMRDALSALPGPVLRPARPDRLRTADAAAGSTDPQPPAPATPPAARASPASPFRLPVFGRTLKGFGERNADGSRSTGLTLAPRNGAQVIAPAPGRVAFAGPYRGYGRIVILEHAGGLTSLVTGLARADVRVGEALVSGASLGVAEMDQPAITLEIRREGNPVNPLILIQ